MACYQSRFKLAAACAVLVMTAPNAFAQETWTCATDSAWYAPLSHHAAVAFGGLMWVLCGQEGSTPIPYVRYSSDGIVWHETGPYPPPYEARCSPAAVVFGGGMWILGGWNGTGNLRDVWSSLNGLEWVCKTANAGWTARDMHAAVAHNGRIWVIGGYDGECRNDVWSSANGIDWACATPAAEWAPRAALAAVTFAGRIWVLGGSDQYSTFNDVWWSEDGAEWTEATPSAAWCSRDLHACAASDSLMWILGGRDNGDSFLNDVWRSSDGTAWTCITDSAEWNPRAAFATLSIGQTLCVLGGWGYASNNDVWTSTVGAVSDAHRSLGPRAADWRTTTPFRYGTHIFGVTRTAGRVRVTIRDVQGREVALLDDATLQPGVHQLEWSGRDDLGRRAPPGVYTLVVEADGRSASARLVMLR